VVISFDGGSNRSDEVWPKNFFYRLRWRILAVVSPAFTFFKIACVTIFCKLLIIKGSVNCFFNFLIAFVGPGEIVIKITCTGILQCLRVVTDWLLLPGWAVES
jgi:hypothetical protein